MNNNKKTVVITGASSGIGKALALSYAQRKDTATLALSGRNKKRLEQVCRECENLGTTTHMAAIDVTDKNSMEKWLCSIDKKHNIDILIANAGISGGTGKNTCGEPVKQTREIFNTNIIGVLNTIEPVLPQMLERNHGNIAIMSSMASFQSWPGAPAYSASKACIRIYGEALGISLAKTGVRVSVIYPGFVKSKITDANDFPMPFLMDSKKAARIIIKGINKKKARIAFPLRMYACTRTLAGIYSILPAPISGKIFSSLPAKPEKQEKQPDK